MPLTQEQFQKARQSGFSTEQIIEFEKKRIGEQPQIPQQTQPKPFWSKFGAEITPQMRQQAPIPSAIAQTAQDIFATPAAFFNQMGFNLPRSILKKADIEYPQPGETTGGKLGYYAGGIAGAVTSPITKALTKLGTAPQTARLSTKITRGALGGATAGLAYTPTEDTVGLEQRAGQATTGAVLGGITGMIAPTVIQFKKWLNIKNQLKLADEARNSLIGQKHNLVESFGKQYQDIIKNTKGQVSLQEPLKGLLENADDVVNTIQGQQEFNEALSKNIPSAKKLLNLIKAFRDNPEIPVNISVEEADALQKFIKQMPGIQGKLQRAYKQGFEQVDWSNSERILLDFANDIKANVLDLAPELKMLNQNYGQFMNNFKQVRPYLKWNNAVTNMRNLHNLDPAILDKFQQTLPKNIINDVLQMNRTIRNANLLKWIGGISMGSALAGGIGSEVGRRIFKR